MRLHAAFLFLAFGTMTAFAQNTTLQALRDQARPLLIFAPATADPAVQQQIADLASHAGGLRDHDMQIVLIPSSAGALHSEIPAASFAPEEEQHARRRFHVAANEFAVILVGKDGGEKLRSSTPLSWQRISSTVDSMPMRKDEMRQR